jgi:hypothetical protein
MPSVGKAAGQAWRDALAVFQKLPGLATTALAIVVAIGLGQSLWRIGPSGIPESSMLVGILAQLVQAFLITPYLIAVHRFIILGEVSRDYGAGFREPRFRRFFAWSLALSAVWWAALALASLPTGSASFVVLVPACTVAIVVSLRVIVLFPALAVDAPGTSWKNAIADTKGRVWRIFLIFLLANLPIFIAEFVVLMAAVQAGIFDGALLPRTWMHAGTLLGGVAEFVYLTLAVVIASRLFEAIGKRLKAAD